MTKGPIVIEQLFNVPPHRIWSAITNKNEMKIWYFELKEFKAEPGFQFQFDGGKDDRIYTHLCEILDIEENKKLVHSWVYKGFDGETIVSFEISPQGENSKLILTHSGLETLPTIDDFRRENFVAGWTAIIGTSLVEYLAKG